MRLCVTAIGTRASGRDLLGKECVGALHEDGKHGAGDFRQYLVCERAHPQVGKSAL
jgi:hypothetical protein